MISRSLRFCPTVVALAIALLISAGCSRREPAADRAARDGVLLQSVGTSAPVIDPQRATTLGDRAVLGALLEGLVEADPHTLAPRPALAGRWDVSADGLIYAFHLRENARWSNGDPVTAQDFAASYHRALAPDFAASNRELMFCLRGARAYAGGELKDFAQVGIAAIGAHTLRLTLDAPKSNFLTVLCHFTWLPVHMATVLAAGGETDLSNPWSKPSKNYISNGPFRIARAQSSQKITLERNPDYWDAAHVKLNGISFFVFGEINAEERAFRSGQIHVTDALPLAKVPVYRDEHSTALHLTPACATYFYRINVTRPPLDDARVRRALSLAINRHVLVGKILNGAYEPAVSFVPPGLAGYQPPTLAPDDATAALSLLQEAGFRDGKKPRSIEILFNKSDIHQPIAETIQSMWRIDLGVDATLAGQESAVALANRKQLNYDVSRGSWFADYSDPASFLEIFTTDNANNQTGWSNAAYDRLIDEASRTADSTQRLHLLVQAEKILLAEAPVIPLFVYSTIRLVDPRVHGWVDNALDLHSYKEISLETAAH